MPRIGSKVTCIIILSMLASQAAVMYCKCAFNFPYHSVGLSLCATVIVRRKCVNSVSMFGETKQLGKLHFALARSNLLRPLSSGATVDEPSDSTDCGEPGEADRALKLTKSTAPLGEFKMAALSAAASLVLRRLACWFGVVGVGGRIETGALEDGKTARGAGRTFSITAGGGRKELTCAMLMAFCLARGCVRAVCGRLGWLGFTGGAKRERELGTVEALDAAAPPCECREI